MKISIKNQRTYSHEFDEHAFSIVRLRNEHISKVGGTGCWVKISNEDRECIYRKVKGAGAIDIPYDALELDYEGFRALNSWSKERAVSGFYPCSLIIRKATKWEALKAHWFHPNPAYSVPMRLGYIGFALGIIGLALSIIGLLR